MLKWRRKDKVIVEAYRRANCGDVDGAAENLAAACRESDASGDRSEALGMILYQAGQYEEAAEALERAAQRQPENMMRVYYFASALARAGQLDMALAALNQAANANPSTAAPVAAQCLILAERADVPAARNAWDQAREIFAANPGQDRYSMGLLQQCSELNIPRPDKTK